MSKKRKKRKKNVRTAGTPARHDLHEDGSPIEEGGAGRMPAVPKAESSPAQQALEREREIRRAAYELYLEEGGDELEVLLENGQYTRGAYQSQMAAARDGGTGWGPTITPYEDRMTRSLQHKLIKERREWIERCQAKIEAGVEEIEAHQREEAEAAAPPLPSIDSGYVREIVMKHMAGEAEEPQPKIEINAGERALEPAGVT